MAELVVVSGAPGAGKSTLAGPLAAALGLPLLSKDTIKETLFDQLGPAPGDGRAWSRQLGAAAMELLWRLAEDHPAVVLEANFRTASTRERRRVQGLSSRPVEVHCRVPYEVAADRFAARAARPGHHPVHVARALTPELFSETAEPFGIGEVIEVDTSHPVDVAAVAAAVRVSASRR